MSNCRDGILSGLEKLQCFEWEVCLETMLFIIAQCPQLRHIWGLDLLMLSPQSISAIQQHITQNNRHIGNAEFSTVLYTRWRFIKKIVKICLHSSKTVQNSFHFDENFFEKFFST